VVFAKRVRHPGMRARPWLRPAIEHAPSEIERAVAEEIRRTME
jgi:hypothetical protein